MTEEQQHRLEIILENMDGKFDLLMEGHASLEKMVTEHRAETRQDKQELQILIQTAHDSLKEDIQKLSAKSDNHEDRITRLEKKVA